jgi:hypothetical protein
MLKNIFSHRRGGFGMRKNLKCVLLKKSRLPKAKTTEIDFLHKNKMKK